MKNNQIQTPTQRQNRHKATEAITMLNKIKDDFKNRLKAMNYFYDLYEKVYCKNETIHKDKIIVGTMCIQVPYELIYALGATPVRLCNGFYTDDEIGSDFLPSKACPLVKSTVGLFKSKNLPFKPEIIISPTTCDQKTKSNDIIRDFDYEVYDLDYPRVKETEEAREYFKRSIRRFTKDLSRFLNKKLNRKNLKQAIKKIGYAQYLYHKLNEFRVDEPLILGLDMFLVTNAFFFDDINRWIENVEKLIYELKEKRANQEKLVSKISPRIVYTGSPVIFPNLKIPYLVESSDAIIVADETCSSNRMFNDMVSVDEWFLYDMVDSISSKYLKGCTCPIFSTNDDRIRRIIDLVRRYSADGVVYQAFAGCQVYEMEQNRVLKALEKEKIPILYIESDYSPSHLGQLTTRIEAFVESLKSKKRKRNKR